MGSKIGIWAAMVTTIGICLISGWVRYHFFCEQEWRCMLSDSVVYSKGAE
jgi:hypothetical protein